MFRTQFCAHDRVFSEPGNFERTIYTGQFDDDGILRVVVAGKENLDDFIQSHRDSVDLKIMLKRYKSGEIQDLARVRGIYGDFTKAPASYAEMLNIIKQGRELFEKLPVDARAEFGHDYNRFVASFDSPIFYNTMRRYGIIPDVPGIGNSAGNPVESGKSVESEVQQKVGDTNE